MKPKLTAGIVVLFLVAVIGVHGQEVTKQSAPRVTVTGEATVQAQPDTAIVMIAVVTQNQSASAAQSENATKSDRVVSALKSLLGGNAEIKTSGYSVQPQRVYKENQPPTISGYEARNTVTVTTVT